MAQTLAPANIPAGNNKDIHPETRVQDLVKMAYKYGPIFQITAQDGGREIVLSNFALVDEVCNETFYDKKVTAPLRTLRGIQGNGLFTADTDDPNWRKAHAILMPNFSMEAMRSYLPMMIDAAEQMLNKWAHLNPDEEIDVGDNMSRVTLDTIGLCAFSYHFNSFWREELHPFVKSMVNLLAGMQKFAGQSSFEKTLRLRERRHLMEDRDLLLNTATHLLQERKAEGEEGLKKHDLLSAMLAGVDKQTGEKLDDMNIRAQIITFLIAGHETTSSLLSFALFFLLNHPEVMAKATAEVDQVLGNDPSKPPTHEQLRKLKYITQILNESLRLAPPAPAFNRYAYEKRLLAGKYEITPDDTLKVLLPVLHRDRSVWGDDAESFHPETHFGPEAEKKRPANAFKPFGTGQRSCIGRQFAMQEATLVLAMILQRFVLYAPRIYRLQIREALTIKPENLFMKVALRSRVDQQLLPLTGEQAEVQAAPAVAEPEAGEQAAQTVPQAVGTKLLVLYGSNAGTSEELANRIAHDGSEQGFTATTGSLDEYVERLPTEGALIIVTSSYNGTPPDNAAKFCQWLQSGLSKDALKGVNYAVFGCGDHDWVDTFQAIPKLIGGLLEKAGAKRIYERGEGDVAGDFDEQFSSWYKGLWHNLAKALSLTPMPAGQARKQQPLYDVEIVRHPHPFPFINSFGALPLTVLDNHTLTKSNGSSDQIHETRHIQVALPADLAYRAGDHLGVIASNESAQVKRVAEHFHFDQQTIIQLHSNNGRKPIAPLEEPISVYDLLANYVELQDVAKREHISKIADYSSDAHEKQHLELLAGSGAESAAAYKAVVLDKHASLIDLLEDHPSCALPFSVYLECLAPLRPRYYSISSSPLAKPDECSITVGVVKGATKSGHGVFEGVCSSYLAQQQKGELLYAFIQNTSGAFHLPQDFHTPLIMVAAGTGLAPFRGFLQSRMVLLQHKAVLGPALLFFGCRHPESDFLYKEELTEYEMAGVVRLYTAFSRLDPQKKVFVQEKLLEHKDEIWQLLQDGAVVYVCGDAATMVPDVRKTFLTLAQEKGAMSAQDAGSWLDGLVKNNRYLVDIWGTGLAL